MNFEVTTALNPEDRTLLQQGLLAITQTYFKVDVQPVSVLARNDDGALIGGLIARSVASWLSIDLIWVAEPHRRAGIGAQLMTHAETAARDRACLGVHVSTGSFEAPGFYQRLGYTLFGVIEDYPPGHRRMFFSKRFPDIRDAHSVLR